MEVTAEQTNRAESRANDRPETVKAGGETMEGDDREGDKRDRQGTLPSQDESLNENKRIKSKEN